MSNSPAKPEKQRAQKPKSPAQLASEANTRQQAAVRGNTARPNDRQAGDQQGYDPGMLTPKPRTGA